jgi:hypothetical protein
LLDGLIDYAGLFPPAGEDMRPALENYARYLRGSENQYLGRFIVPVARLGELEEVGADLLPRDATPWRLSVLAPDNPQAASERLARFNSEHAAGSRAGHALVDVVESKASSVGEVREGRAALARTFGVYFEVPVNERLPELVETMSQVGARAKIRTGGVTSDAFPTSRAIVEFLSVCRRFRVPFKATAGLHHPVRGDFRLTYEPDSEKSTMYGFLNVFLAAAALYAGRSEKLATEILGERDASAFTFDDDGISWQDTRVTTAQLVACRSEFAIAFGSCSFREPVDELFNLTRNMRTADK